MISKITIAIIAIVGICNASNRDKEFERLNDKAMREKLSNSELKKLIKLAIKNYEENGVLYCNCEIPTSTIDSIKDVRLKNEGLSKYSGKDLIEKRIQKMNAWYCGEIIDLCPRNICDDSYALNQIKGKRLLFTSMHSTRIISLSKSEWPGKNEMGILLADEVRYIGLHKSNTAKNILGFDVDVDEYDILDPYITDGKKFKVKPWQQCE